MTPHGDIMYDICNNLAVATYCIDDLQYHTFVLLQTWPHSLEADGNTFVRDWSQQIRMRLYRFHLNEINIFSREKIFLVFGRPGCCWCSAANIEFQQTYLTLIYHWDPQPVTRPQTVIFLGLNCSSEVLSENHLPALHVLDDSVIIIFPEMQLSPFTQHWSSKM